MAQDGTRDAANMSVVVTGASSGIGAATAKLYAAKGAHVWLLARNPSRLAAVAAEIGEGGGEASIVPVDLSDPRAVKAAADTVLSAGAPDILVNNAGAGLWRPLLETPPEELRAQMAVPYFAAFDLTRALLPAMIARRTGQIAFVSSPASYLVWPNAAGYIAARHAVKGLADALRSELKPYGIGVSLIVFGTVNTPYWQHNPGSRENLPAADRRLFPTLSAEEAAETIVHGLQAKKRTVVRPGLFRALFLLRALWPSLVDSQLRKASKRAKH